MPLLTMLLVDDHESHLDDKNPSYNLCL